MPDWSKLVFWCSKFHHWRPNKAEFLNLPAEECEKSACYGRGPANYGDFSDEEGGFLPLGTQRMFHRTTNRYQNLNIKVDIPHFTGEEQLEEVLDWLNEVERVFEFLNLLENKKVKLVAIKLKGYASSWWQQV